MTQFTPTQQTIVEHAITRTDGRIQWFPENIKGGARRKVLQSLVAKGAITQIDGVWHVAVAADGAEPAPQAVGGSPQGFRAGSKQALVVSLLQRPEGATIAQIMGATSWQAHTVRGTLAGTFKRKGLAITSDKLPGQDRIYRSV
ncbi:MAG: DUF3489 domain-containing protein [Castellaniella sp.]|uniref:DUF3489 domain-containing protein n=1 Tax=Castellaniella sp. TaxID=1955812 RepID=UPI003A856246